MKFSEISLYVMALCTSRHIRFASQFWRLCRTPEDVMRALGEDGNVPERLEREKNRLLDYPTEINVTCAFDGDFPSINARARGDIPFILFYRGDIALIKDAADNVAVIGTTSPTPEIEEREEEIVAALTGGGMNIVSGLAIGCDSRAHSTCLDAGGKTVAILPGPLSNIYPACNRGQAEKIACGGGLLVTEYIDEAESKREAVTRFIQRDRLQALFSKAVALIASFSVGRGGSGSRHAMEYAGKLSLPRYAMFSQGDAGEKLFGLNADYIESGRALPLDPEGVPRLIALGAPPCADISGGLPVQLDIFRP